jgi:hypothetical protein
MKHILSIALLLITTGTISSQNLLSSLYNLEPFPEEMEWGKTFIDQLGDDTLIYNYIGGGGRDGMSGFQFDLRDKDGLNLQFPFTDEISFLVTDRKSTELSKEASFYLTYKFLLTRYRDMDEPLTEKDFSLKNMFSIATEYYDMDAYALVHEVLLNDDSNLDDEARRNEFFNQLAQALEIEDLDFKQISEDLTAENYTQREIEEALLDHILEEVEDYEQLTVVIYDTFIDQPDEEDEKTQKKLDRIFSDNLVVSKLEREVMRPEIRLTSSQKMFLNISEEYVLKSKESMGSFAYDVLTISIDFKNSLIHLEFENKYSQNITFHNSVKLPDGLDKKSVKIKKIKLEISEDELTYEFIQPSGYSSKVPEPILIEGNK